MPFWPKVACGSFGNEIVVAGDWASMSTSYGDTGRLGFTDAYAPSTYLRSGLLYGDESVFARGVGIFIHVAVAYTILVWMVCATGAIFVV